MAESESDTGSGGNKGVLVVNENAYSFSFSAAHVANKGQKELLVVTKNECPFSLSTTDGSKEGNAQVSDEGSLPITEDSLKKFFLSESLMTDLSTLVAILVGLEGCRKEDVLRHFLDEEVNHQGEVINLAEVGECNKEGLSFYEFAVAGDSKASDSYDWSFFTRSSGYLKCFISAFLRHDEIKDRFVHAMHPPTGTNFFGHPLLDEHFRTILEGLHSHFSPDTTAERSPPREDDIKLSDGLSLINIWDIENANKAVKLFFSMLAGKLNNSLVLLGQNLLEQVKTPDDKKCLELLRFAHLAKHDDPDRPKASIGIGLVASSQTPTEEEVAKLTPQLKKLVTSSAKGVGVEGYVMEDPVIFDAKKTKSIKNNLEVIARVLTSKKSIPLSWIFLRGAFFKSGQLYVEKETLKAVSSKLQITEKSFEEFLAFGTAGGSLIYNPQIPALRRYVVLNPADFCYRLNGLFKARFDGDLKKGVVPMSYLRRIFGSDADFFQEILVSSKHAIKVDMKRIKYLTGSRRPSFHENLCFFIPIIREEEQEVEEHADSLFLQVKSTFLPNNVGQILVERLLRNASVSLVATEYSNVVSFKYKAEDSQDSVEFSVIFRADACEIQIQPSDGCRQQVVQDVRSLLIDSCLFIRYSEKEAFVPFGTQVVGIGVMCTTRGGFHCFPCFKDPCQKCAVAVNKWQPTYNGCLSREIQATFNKQSTVTEKALFKFSKRLYQNHISSVEDVKKLMEALGQPQESCTESTAAMHLSGALLTCAALKKNSTFALFNILKSVNLEYGMAFCTYIAAQV